MERIFFDLGIIIIIATILTIIFKYLKQPAIPAYMLTGIIMGPFFLNLVTAGATIQAFSQIGIAFLLFIVGLNLNVRLLKEVGKVSFLGGIGQIFFTSFMGYFILKLLGFSLIESIYISVALSFSSTIIVVKLLSDKKDIERLYGKISIGFLLVQDAVAVFILIFLSSFKTNELVSSFGFALINGLILLGIAYLATRFFLTKFFERVARSQETLFLSAVSWCFTFSIIAHMLGFGIEIGAFLAGICLASLPYNMEISNKVRPLRDFFVILFFFIIGSSVEPSSFISNIPTIIWLSLFVLIGNTLLVMIIMGFLGFKSRTSFLTGLNIAQISEFSLIMIAMGKQLGHISMNATTIVSSVGIITIAVSTYLITNNEKIYVKLAKFLGIFERKKLYEDQLAHHEKKKQYDIILLGQQRIGYSLLKNLIKNKKKILVVDYNPEIIKSLIQKRIPCLYGDIADPDVLHEIKSYKPKIVISTVHLFDDNIMVTKIFRKFGKNVAVILTANNVTRALDLYDEGADYVILPQILGGEKVSEMLNGTIQNKKKLKKLKNDHIKFLMSAELPQ